MTKKQLTLGWIGVALFVALIAVILHFHMKRWLEIHPGATAWDYLWVR